MSICAFVIVKLSPPSSPNTPSSLFAYSRLKTSWVRWPQESIAVKVGPGGGPGSRVVGLMGRRRSPRLLHDEAKDVANGEGAGVGTDDVAVLEGGRVTGDDGATDS